MVIAFRI